MSLGILMAQPATAAPGHQTRATTATPPVYIGEHKIRTAAIVDRGYLLVPVRGVFEQSVQASNIRAPNSWSCARKER
jgi:hypothetical protein